MIISEWVRVPGFPAYRLSRNGLVYSTKRRKLMKPTITWRGYKAVMLQFGNHSKRVMIHRALLMAFVGPPGPCEQARHLNCDKLDNRLANLAWGTCAENIRDGIRHGKHARGERHGNAKLSEDQVRAIIRESAAGVSQRALGRKYSVAGSTIGHIINKESWTHVAGAKP